MTKGQEEAIYALLRVCKEILQNFDKGYDLNNREKMDQLRRAIVWTQVEIER